MKSKCSNLSICKNCNTTLNYKADYCPHCDDPYIKQVLKLNNPPKELIELKRTQLKAFRMFKPGGAKGPDKNLVKYLESQKRMAKIKEGTVFTKCWSCGKNEVKMRHIKDHPVCMECKRKACEKIKLDFNQII